MTQGEKEAWSRYIIQWVTLGTTGLKSLSAWGQGVECISEFFLPKHEDVVSFTFQPPFVILLGESPGAEFPVFGPRHRGEHRMAGPGRT